MIESDRLKRILENALEALDVDTIKEYVYYAIQVLDGKEVPQRPKNMYQEDSGILERPKNSIVEKDKTEIKTIKEKAEPGVKVYNNHFDAWADEMVKQGRV